MTNEITTKLISDLYRKYKDDLRKVRKYQRRLYYEKGYSKYEKYLLYRAIRYAIKKIGYKFINRYGPLHPQLCDIEAEITYLLIREFKPKNIVEISPCGGWSSSWILHAIRDNKFGKLYSYDLIDKCLKNVPKFLIKNNWEFIQGDIKRNLNKLPKKVDYLFMDSDHSSEFANWYIENIFPKLSNGTPINVHDVFTPEHILSETEKSKTNNFFKDVESKVIINWLKKKNINYYTTSPLVFNDRYEKIITIKHELKLSKKIHLNITNSMIYFLLSL
jgi:predicted O-methyltransferase YrrM